MTPNPRTDHNAMLAIQRLLNDTQWDANTLERIAIIIENAGYRLRDYEEE